jgi:hypothetical protein
VNAVVIPLRKSAIANPYQTPESKSLSTANATAVRFASLAKCVAFLIGGLFFAWNLLVIYAFASMVDPALPSDQQTSETFRRFLFGDGIHQIFIVTGMFVAALICFALAGTNIWTVATGKRTKTRLSIMSTGAVTLTIIVFGMIYLVFA